MPIVMLRANVLLQHNETGDALGRTNSIVAKREGKGKEGENKHGPSRKNPWVGFQSSTCAGG